MAPHVAIVAQPQVVPYLAVQAVEDGAQVQSLAGFLLTYNYHRPQSELQGQPAITRLVTHLCGKDT